MLSPTHHANIDHQRLISGNWLPEFLVRGKGFIGSDKTELETLEQIENTVTLFLLHLQASLVIAITLPMAVLMAVLAMKVFGVDANIMSLAGIAIAIGTMVDMGIIVLENISSFPASLFPPPEA